MNAPENSKTALAIVTKLEVHSSADLGKYLDWLTRLMMLGVESTGALSAEIFPPQSFGTTEWVLVQRFYTLAQIEKWQKSDRHQELMNELTPSLESKQVTISESIDPTGGSVSIAVVTHVREGHEKEYFTYERKYQSAQAQSSGYHGAYVQPPQKSTPGSWITIIRFDSPRAIDQWFDSSERKKLITEADELVSSTDFQNGATSFPGWFPSEAKAGEGPPNWKTALLILLGLYPSVMLVIKYFLPLMHGFSPALNNFIGNILTVAFTTWVTMPLFIKMYKSWLFPNPTTPKWVSPLSVISLLFFFVLEVAFFWRFF